MADLNPIFDVLDGLQNQIYAIGEALINASGPLAAIPEAAAASAILSSAGSTIVGYAATGSGQIAAARASVQSSLDSPAT